MAASAQPATALRVERRIDGLDQLPLDAPRIGALHGAARHFGFDHSPATVYGGTGHAFVINIHGELCPSGPLVWQRQRSDRLAANLGIAVEYLGFFTADADAAERSAVDAELRRAVDAGLPCAICNDEYQLIVGYDAEGFDLIGPEHLSRRLTFGTWQEWGAGVYAYIYIHRGGAPVFRARLVSESLEFALDV